MHYITISIFIVLFSVSSLAQNTFKNGIISSSSSNKSKINTIMIEDGRKGYEFNNRNVKDSRAFKIVEHQGKRAALFKLTLDMKGAEGDWFRNNKPGNAQRFEFGETKENAQKFNQEIWTRISIFIPKGTISKTQTTLFDLKEIRNNQTFGPILNLAISDEGQGSILKMKHQFEKNECIIGKEGNSNNSFCDKTDLNIIIGDIENFTGEWFDFISRAVWSNKPNGEYDAWINNNKIIGYRGNTSYGADKIRFKFGLYRINLNKVKNPKDIQIYFSNVGTSYNCKNLKINYCKKLEETKSIRGYPNAKHFFRYKVNEKTNFINSGGKVLKTF